MTLRTLSQSVEHEVMVRRCWVVMSTSWARTSRAFLRILPCRKCLPAQISL